MSTKPPFFAPHLRTLASVVVLPVLLFVHRAVAASPFGDARWPFPGTHQAKVQGYWIAPYVFYTESSFGSHREGTVRWYDTAGNIKESISGPRVGYSLGYFTQVTDAGPVIYSIDGSWHMLLPRRNMFERANVGGEVIMRQYECGPGPGQTTMIDVFHRDQLLGSVGPFSGHRYSMMHLADNGYATLIHYKDEQRTTSQLVLISPEGKIVFRDDCGEKAIRPRPVAQGKGVVVELEGKDAPAHFEYISADGTHVLFDPHILGDLHSDPASEFVIVRPNGLTPEHLQLARATTGELLWDIETPVQNAPHTNSQALITGDKVLVLGQDAAAVDLHTGKLLAHWNQHFQNLPHAHFYHHGDDIYILTNEEIYKLDLNDITAKRNGWK